MKKIVMTFLTALAAGCADHTMPVAQLPEIDTNNPLLAEWNTPHETPPFDRIRVSDYEPAFDAAIAVQRAEIEAIRKAKSESTGKIAEKEAAIRKATDTMYANYNK